MPNPPAYTPGDEHPPAYDHSERRERRPREDRRPRVISFPVELETNYRTRGHWGQSAERHRERVNIDSDTSFTNIQRQLREKHLTYIPFGRSFTWTTWLKYANGQRRQVRGDNWEGILQEVMALGSAKDQRGGGFPVAFVSQSNEMSVETWEGLREDMARDERGWGVEGWKEYMLQRGYWFKERPMSERERAERREKERREARERENSSRGHRRGHGHRHGYGGHGMRDRLARMMHHH